MKKLLTATLLCALSFSASAAIDLDGKTFEAVGSEPISLSFENGKATLDTRCYDAVGVYSVSESNGKNKINFALKDYINVLPKEECIQSPIEKSMVISALHSLTWNDSFESKVNNDFGVTVNVFGETGAIISYTVQ